MGYLVVKISPWAPTLTRPSRPNNLPQRNVNTMVSVCETPARMRMTDSRVANPRPPQAAPQKTRKVHLTQTVHPCPRQNPRPAAGRAGAGPTKPYVAAAVGAGRDLVGGWWRSRCTAATSTLAVPTAAPLPRAGGRCRGRHWTRSGSAASCATAPAPSRASPGRRRGRCPRHPRI